MYLNSATDNQSSTEPLVELPGRALIFAMNYAPEVIGCGRYTGEIGAYLDARGVKVEVVTTPPHYPAWKVAEGYKSGYSVEVGPMGRINRCPIGLSKNMRGFGRLWAPLSFALSSAPVVFWRILRFRPTHVFCIEPTLFGAPAALLAAKLVGAKTVLHVQDLEVDAAFAVGHLNSGPLKTAAMAYERFVTKAFNRVVTISRKMADRLAEKGVKPEQLRIVRNWVDVSRIYPMETSSPFRKELSIGQDEFVVLYSGAIGVKQALHLVMDAAERLSGHSNIRFVIAGEGPEKANLQARNLANVQFLPLQPEGKLNALLSLADAHVLPQIKNSADLVLPSKIGGMLASGKRIIAMADPGTEIYEFLDGAATIIPAANVEALVQSILSLQAGGASPNEFSARAEKLSQLKPENIVALFSDASP